MLNALRLTAILLLASGAAFASNDDGPTDANAKVHARDAAEGAIRAQAARFSAAYVAADVEALVQIYTEDGVAGPSGSDFIRGHQALRKLWTRAGGSKVLRHKLSPVEIVVDGDHAYDWGYYEGATGTPTKISEFNGKYLVVWRRGADGQWRMAQDVWNSMPAQ